MTLALHPRAVAAGKVIVLGEHAVVHGYPALAAGLPESLVLRTEAQADPMAPLRLVIPAWGIDLVLRADEPHPVARAALEVLGFCDGPLTGWTIQGETRLPSQAGLGSSAALTVALARLVLGQEADHAEVVAASMAGERIFHGNPSGIDSELAARSGLVRFVRGEPPEPISLRAPFELVIVPSGVPRSTAAQVEKVSQRIQQVPRLARPMLELLGTAVGSGIDSLMRNDFNTFGMILSMSHELLSGLGASSPTLDRLCAVALETGALGAKLTGAGGGGCIIALPSGPARPLMDAFITHGERPLRLEVTP